MQINRTQLLKDGKRKLTVTLDEGENILPIRNNMHYKLAEQLNDVIHADYLLGAVPVIWCSLEQKWVE